MNDGKGSGPAGEARRMPSFYSRFVGPGSLCFDVGANAGNRTETFLDLGAAVVAVEPQPGCAARLRERFGHSPRFTLVEAALGPAEGWGELLVSPNDTISTMSADWMDTVRRTERFAGEEWPGRQRIRVATLDRLVIEHGLPDFLKIDVEGYEAEVLRGLSMAPAALSFEFTPEFMDAALECLGLLSRLGRLRCNLSLEESLRFGLPDWTGPEEMAEVLHGMREIRTFGDVYVVFGAVPES